MSLSGKGSPDNTKAARPSTPVNLTAASEPMGWEQACSSVFVAGPGETLSLDVRGMTYAENERINDGSHDSVYVVVSGFGLLCSGDTELPCTAGDVLFVPRGCAHRFERLDGDIRIWRIAPTVP